MTETDQCECQCGKLHCASRRIANGAHGRPRYREGCRCEICVAAETEHSNDRRFKVNRVTANTATKTGQQWTGPELEIATRPDLTVRQAALMLGRTYRAVDTARYKCRHDPKWVAVVGAALDNPDADRA